MLYFNYTNRQLQVLPIIDPQENTERKYKKMLPFSFIIFLSFKNIVTKY